MSDQEAKPANGVEAGAPVQTPEAKVKQETAPEATSVKDGEITNVKDEEMEDAGHIPEATSTVKDEEDEKLEAEDKAEDSKPSIHRPPKGMLRVDRRGHEKEGFERHKSDASVLPDSDDPKEIRKQVEFYFGNSNLSGDKFLWAKTEGEKNKPVPLSLICSFSRMRRFKPYSAVVDALKSSNFLVVEGAEGEETVRRKNPYDPAKSKRHQMDERSSYIKGFGEEQTSTQFDIEAFLSSYGEFNSVRLRRVEDEKRAFKGSVFVEWADKETAERFVALKPQPTWKGYPLHILSKLEYQRQKAKEIREGRVPMKGSENFRGGRGHRGGKPNRGSNHSRGNHRGGDPNDWNKRREQDQKNGFEDRRGRNHRGRGRGRGRGGRGNFRGGRDRAENGGDRVKEDQSPSSSHDAGRPRIHTSKEGAKIMKEGQDNSDAQANGKRARDQDTAAEEPSAKKVHTQEAVASTA
ncbi:hypothetical protein F5B20DRAFT_481222 [Whalleya microplaca]|nr:hypothetical protein F5B20DRAFT_481222 [Whalleya microplaca]